MTQLFGVQIPIGPWLVTKIILIAVGGMIFLDNLGISLTPLVTTLGVGSLAVAIALQDTLGNFFAGLYINSKLAQTTIVNFHLPQKRMALHIPVGFSYDSDPQTVEDVLVDEAKKAVGDVDGLLGQPEPFVRFIPGFGDFSMNFTLICQVREFADQYWVQHELRKRIFKRLQREGMQDAIRPLIPWSPSPAEKPLH
jgi:small-conductance mechanosensitive channel